MTSLDNLLAAQLTGFHVGPQTPEVYGQKPTNIVYAANGIFRVVKTPVALFTTKIGEVNPKTPVLGVEAMEAGPQLLIPKIPFRYLNMILSWYKDVNIKDRTEASVLFFWNHNNVALPSQYADDKPVNGLLVDGQLVIYCPIQRNSGALSEFHMDTMVTWLRENLSLLCETHSHNTMNAFFSGTDDANENATQFYGVWGKVMDAEPAFAFRWVCGDQKVQVTPDVLFDWPKKTIKTIEVIEEPGKEPIQVVKEEKYELIKGPFAHEDYPEDWMPQHTKAVTVQITPSYNSHQGSQYPYRNQGAGANNHHQAGAAQRLGSTINPADYDVESAWAEYEAEQRALRLVRDGEGDSKKHLENLKEVSGTSLGNADVIEVHNQDDVLNLRVIENEAKDIAEDLRDYGFDTVIEAAIDGARQSVEERRVN